ncbi:hypothetical protein [Streptomyces sp. ID01-9D]|uniref:hypothetical protein n=1 Tax=Streptomyces sp. ID01-9D TaxID=3028659 RepID=UPI0029CA32A4|nr:hypothetical protein [Streptomyces sp. ID01-9D]
MNRSHPRLARYPAALTAGADPAVVTQWTNDAQHDKRTAPAKPNATRTATVRSMPSHPYRYSEPLVARWRVEEAIKLAKSACGLADYEVRSFHRWHRHITLTQLAAAFLAPSSTRRPCASGAPSPRSIP